MPAPTHLLERAYQLINAHQFQNAELVLDAVVRVDPQNMDAWETYLMIHQNQNDLDWLKERILKTKELSEFNKAKLVNYYNHLTKHLSKAEEFGAQPDSNEILFESSQDNLASQENPTSQFELINVFDYPAHEEKEIQPRTRTRKHRRAIYNPFTPELINGILKTMSNTPFGKKAAPYIQKAAVLARNFANNPKDTFDELLKTPNVEKYMGTGLLLLFVLGIRLIIANHLFGYILLGIFFIGGRQWLISFGMSMLIPPLDNDKFRVYQHENKDDLLAIKELEKKEEKKANKATK